MKLYTCNYLDMRVMNRFHNKPKVPVPFEVPLPYAFTITQLGQIKISGMANKVYLFPSALEDIDLMFGYTLDRIWTSAVYARVIEYAQTLGVWFTTIDLKVQRSSWWIYRHV